MILLPEPSLPIMYLPSSVFFHEKCSSTLYSRICIVPVKQCVISNTAIQSQNVLDDPYIEIHRLFNLLDGFA